MLLYTSSIEDLSANKLHGFFVGWRNPPSTAMHIDLLKNSDEVILAINGDTGNVVGFITAITDKVLTAYIPFLEVLPEYQGQGVGQELIRRMLERLNGFYAIDLLCDRDLQPFYANFGMKPAFGMMLRNYEWQSGKRSSLA
jgi:ribosomal protein S18 acetylase RimI-like enzyme